jgi:excisionase family DNA binding protein
MRTNYQHEAAVTSWKEVSPVMDTLHTVEQAAQRLGVSVWTIYRLARTGQLASIRLGRRRLFAERDLEELIRKTRVGPPAGNAPGGSPGDN